MGECRKVVTVSGSPCAAQKVVATDHSDPLIISIALQKLSAERKKRWVGQGVIFQHDPFAGLDAGEILFCLESDRTLGSCPINANWTRLAFGPEVLRDFADRPVSCAGTLFARPVALVSYLLHMTRAIAETRPETRHSGIDQAIHNVILNRGLVAGTRALPNGEVVLTVPADAEARYAIDDAGDILAPSGAVPAVVHQYDRNPALLRHVRERFGGG